MAHWLLIRHSVAKPEDLAFYRALGRRPRSPRWRGWRARWTIEERFQRAKEIGLDQDEVRRWPGWRQPITLGLLAHAFLRDDAGGGRKRQHRLQWSRW